jgi:hypothetical protein
LEQEVAQSKLLAAISFPMFKNLFAKTPPAKEPIFPGEKLSMFKLNLEDGWGLATINKAYDNYQNKALFPWYAIINIHLQDQNENGHPTAQEAEVLNRIEKRVTDFLKQEMIVHFIGRVIRPGERDLLYYLDDHKFQKEETKTFFDDLNAIRPINFELHKDPRWALVKTFLT